MSLFNIFGNDSNKDSASSKMDWNTLNDVKQLNQIVEESAENPVLIFKHSTRCSISRFALKQFENEFDLVGKVKPYFLDLLNYREISNEIAQRFGVQHQSPQIIVIKNGVAVYDTSHDSIEASALKRFVV
ncbi:bacillithiol system protein YtxJ [Flavobacterium arsenatis]|uniref:Bacillithiol system protein YtxJ n=1 Tax=Flavobacterium arsenatis TaxID=1484332 RepID=A0ABU1TMS5_9FLAO|nr:bacillithiol system redox-active protein YtxJ [Flavobacterium arsenatis]MDR6967270.1 bacillithiol system protein YtxJ [Flavobacterium arsenatis]